MTSILTIIQQQDDEYDRLHAEYESAKQRISDATTPEELATATTAFEPIQQAFLRNREQAVPTEVYQIIASYLDRQSRAHLAECDKHLHYQVIYGKYSGRFVWSVGGLLEQEYRRTHKKRWPDTVTMTPLLHACREGTARVVRVLIDGKANLEAVDDAREYTPLHWACWESHEEVTALLINGGANVNALADSHSPLYSAVAFANSLPIVRRLLAAGANPNDGTIPPMVIAAHDNNCEMASVLLEAKADVNYIDNDGHTALHIASSNNAIDIFPLLLAAGVANYINLTNHEGCTSLLYACLENKTDAAIALLEANADPNIINANNSSPLMYACLRGNVDSVRALLAANANVHLANNDGDTPLKLAKVRKRNDSVIALLLSAGAVDDDAS